MSDQDFNFRPPVERREAKPFEPPPWEKPQFEELDRRRAEEREAAELSAAVAAAAASEAAAAAEIDVAAEVAEAARAPLQAPATAGPAPQVVVAGGQDVAPAEQTAVSPAATGLDERRVAAMLMVLRDEEPPAFEGVWKVAFGASIISAILGLVLSVWGVVAMVKLRAAGVTGMVGGMTLLFFGIGFAGVGAWIGFKALRERGVL